MQFRSFRVAAAIAACMLSTPAFAGDWELLKDDNTCLLTMSFEGPGSTKVSFVTLREDVMEKKVGFFIDNQNWSVKNSDTVTERLTFDADGDQYWNDHPVTHEHGLGMMMTEDMLGDFKDTKSVTIKLGDRVIDRLNFSDFYIGYIQFASCTSAMRAPIEEATRKKKLYDSLPVDPFKKP